MMISRSGTLCDADGTLALDVTSHPFGYGGVGGDSGELSYAKVNDGSSMIAGMNIGGNSKVSHLEAWSIIAAAFGATIAVG